MKRWRSVAAGTTVAIALAATPARAAAPSEKEASSAEEKKEASKRPRFPRLVIAGGPMIGPHAFGNEECRSESQSCEKRGTFFGAGFSGEARLRLYKPLYIHARGLIASNVSPNDRIYSGIGGGGLGLGAYGRRVFARGEFLLLGAYGDDSFTPPFHAEPTGRDEWGNVAGMLAAGIRQPFLERFGAELWGGLVIGPSSVRTVPSAEPDERILTTFMLGLNLTFDAWR